MQTTYTEAAEAAVSTAKPAAESRCYTVEDLQNILSVSRSSVYALLKKEEFRWIRIGSQYRIPRKSFDRWLEQQD